MMLLPAMQRALLGGVGGSPGWVVAGARVNTATSAAGSSPTANGTSSIGNFGITFVNNTGAILTKAKLLYPGWKPTNSPLGIVKDWILDTKGAGFTSATITASPPSVGGATATFEVPAEAIVGGQIQWFICRSTGAYPAGEVPTLSVVGDGTGATAHVTMDNVGEVDYRYATQLFDALEYPLGTPVRLLWGGASSGLVGRGGNGLSDEFTIAGGGIQLGDKYRLRFSASINSSMATLTAVKTSTAVTSVAINNGGANLFQNNYPFVFNSGGGSGATGSCFTYQGSVVKTEVTAGGSYTGVPTVAMTFQVEGPTVLAPLPTDTTSVVAGDQSLAAQTTVAYTARLSPFLMVQPAKKLQCVLLVGASQDAGFAGGESLGDYMGNQGWIARMLGQAGIGMLKRALPGDYASTFALNHTRFVDMARMVTGATSAIHCNGYNDLQRGDSLATIQANLISNWTTLRALVPKVFQTTMFPNAASTDGYITTVNQAARTGWGIGSTASQLSDWIRAGAPIIVGVAVAIGTPGALLAGQPGHPLFGYVECADQIEAGRNTGLWVPLTLPGGFANSTGCTGDGFHPRDSYHARLQGTTASISQSPGSGYTSASVTLSNLGFASATPVFTGGALTGFTNINDGGKDYEFVPSVGVVSAGAGSGATVTAVLTNKRLTGLNITAAGSGYTNGAALTFSGAIPPMFTPSIVSGGVVLSMDFAGTNITQQYSINISGDGTGATATPTILRPVDLSLL